VREVHNYVRALEHGVERLSTLPLSLRLMRELHALLMDGVRGERQTPGAFRTRQNWIGAPGCELSEASYVPPPVGEMGKALDALERFLHAETLLPPLVRLGLIHYQFEAIHPFLDGNGRIGRLLISLLLCAWDLLPRPLLYLSAYFHAHRDRYYDQLLAVSRDGAWETWLTFFLRGVADQSRDAIARIQRIQDLRERYREQFQTARAAARLLQVVDLLFAQPVLTVGQIEAALEIAYNTAHQYIRQLEKAGLLREITGQARNRVYLADEVLEAIEAPLGQ
jgi:Fic family protein